jgi:hypothetical protein
MPALSYLVKSNPLLCKNFLPYVVLFELIFWSLMIRRKAADGGIGLTSSGRLIVVIDPHQIDSHGKIDAHDGRI